jgi:hypothetical protein
MSRAKVIIDSKLQDNSLWELWKSQAPKTTKSFSSQKSRLNFIELTFFAVTIGPNGKARFFSVEKYHLHTSGEQITEDTAKNIVLSDGTDFLQAAKFHRNDISKKRTHAPQFDQTTHKPIVSLIGPLVLEKRRKTFFCNSKPDFEKN